MSDLLAQALALEADARAGFVHEACAGDEDLEAEVLSLLRLSGDTAVDEVPGIDPTPFLDSLSASGRSTNQHAAELPGNMSIAGYRVIRVLGEGGMGIVYEAEQENPRRRVALKVIRGFGGSTDALKRFAREADVLARLQHPGICQVHEVGRTEAGVPYIAMELIEGPSLLEHAEKHELDRLARLALACRIADAVAHAHERGIVHRDLKPDNILVTADGQPKIVDFGIARASELTAGSTLLTSTGAVVGTVSYMSPEQAAGQRDVDHRADIFSLGVICFELLSGRLPMSLDGLSLPQALHVIQQGDLSLAGRGVPTLRGDLETILGKALERDPERRYADAEAFAADIRRHLDHEPIVARPPSVVYRVAKFTRRHRILVAAVGIAFTALFAGTTVALRQMRLAEAEGRRATERAEVAERQSYRAILQAASSALTAGHPSEAREELVQAPVGPRGWEADYLDARVEQSFGREIPAGVVWGATFSRDGASVLALAGEPAPGEILQFALTDLELVARHPLDARPLVVPEAARSLAIRGVLLARPLGDDFALVDAESGAFVARVRTCSTRPGATRLPQVSADGRLALLFDQGLRAEGAGEGYRVCDLRTGELLPGQAGGGLLAVLAPRTAHLLVPSNSVANIVDMESGEIAWTTRSGSDGTSSAAFSVDGDSVYTAGMMTDPFLRKWDLSTGEVVAERRFPGSSGSEPWAFSADGSVLAVGADQGAIHVFDAELEDELAVVALPPIGRPIELALGPRGRLLAMSPQGGKGLRVWDLEAPKAQTRLAEHETYVYAVAFSPDGSSVVSAGWDNTVRTWDAHRREPIGVFRAEGLRHVAHLAWSRDGRRLFVASGGTLFVLDATTGSLIQRVRVADGVATGIQSFAEHPSRPWLAVRSRDRTHLLDSSSLEEIRRIEGSGSLTWSPDGRFLAIADPDERIVVRDSADFRVLWASQEPGGLGGRVAWTADGERLAVFVAGHFVILDSRSGTVLQRFEQRGGPMSFGWSPAGRRLVVGDIRGGVSFWNVETGELVLRLQRHAAYVKSLCFSPDGLLLATASGDADVRLWDATPLREREARARVEPSVVGR